MFADAAGVVRTGNTVVFRIGSDALGTAQAMMRERRGSGAGVGRAAARAPSAWSSPRRTPQGGRCSPTGAWRWRSPAAQARRWRSSARWRGRPASRSACTARAGRGSWLLADADRERFVASVIHSLDRKVCNTAQRVLHRPRAGGRARAGVRRGRACGGRCATTGRSHPRHCEPRWRSCPTLPARRRPMSPAPTACHDEPFVSELPSRCGSARNGSGSARRRSSLHVVDSVADAVALYNRLSPRFVASLISESPAEHDRFFATVDAPFVGDGFTRWVDGQYALGTPSSACRTGSPAGSSGGERSCQATASSPSATGPVSDVETHR